MTEAANWGKVTSLIDNSAARREPSDDSAYVQPLGDGVAKPRGFKVKMPENQEPVMVWGMVVGSIAVLFLLSRAFKTAKA
jgi:hypothetical protein